MAEGTAAREIRVPKVEPPQALPAALGIHVGLAIVCASAVYTTWQRSIVTLPQWAAMLAVAFVLLATALPGGPDAVRRAVVRFTLALAGLLVFCLCYDPQIESFERVRDSLSATFLSTNPSIALVGVAIAFFSWLAYRSFGGERGSGAIPYRRSVTIATGLVILLALFMYAMLHDTHNLAASETLKPVMVFAQGGALVVVLLGIGGGPGVRKAPHVYLALALIAAFVRNLAAGQ